MLADLLTVAVLAFIGTRLLGAAGLVGRRDVRRHIVAIVRGIRPTHVLLAVPVLAAVATAAALLVEVPGLDWGWWTAIGGEGNPVVGSTERTAGTALEWLIPLVFLLLLVPVLPLFAEREEQIFRAGAEEWSAVRRLRRALEFGLVHALIGIPIGVAVALSIGGGYFMWRYRRAFARSARRDLAVLESTRAHTAYNGLIVVLVLPALLVTA